MNQRIETDDAPAAIGPYSQAIKVGNLIFSAGQVALKPGSGDLMNATIEEEVHQVMSNLKAVAQAGGTSLDKAVKTTIFTTDLGLFGRINEAYGSYFKGTPPARSTVQVASLPKGAKVEIEMIFSTD